MSIPVTCLACGAKDKAADHLAGKRAKCRGCGAVMDIPPLTKSCPFCAETIAASAIKCRYCAEFLDGRTAVSTPRQSPAYSGQPEAATFDQDSTTQPEEDAEESALNDLANAAHRQTSGRAARALADKRARERLIAQSRRMVFICAIVATVSLLVWFAKTGGHFEPQNLWNLAVIISAFAGVLTVVFLIQYLFCVLLGRFIWKAAIDGKAVTSIPPSLISACLYTTMFVLTGMSAYGGYLFGPRVAAFNRNDGDWTKWWADWGGLTGAGVGLVVGLIIATAIKNAVSARSCPKCKWYWVAEVLGSEFAGSSTTSYRTVERVHTYDATGRLSATTDVPVERQHVHDNYNVYCRCRNCGHEWTSRRSWTR